MLSFRLRLHATVALLLLLLFAVAAPVAAQDDESALRLSEYRQLVVETQQLARAAEDGDDEARRALQDVTGRWRAVEEVTLPDGSRVAVDHGLLVAELNAADPEYAGLRMRLDALEAVIGRWPAETVADAGAAPALAQLEEILSRPQFQWAEEEPSLQEMLWDYLLRFLRRLLPDSLEASPLVARFVTGAALLFLLGVLLYVGRTFLQSVSPASRTAPAGPAAGTLKSDTALEQAQDFSRSGDYRTAVRYLYLSTLLLLDERGLLRFDRARTNGEYLESMAQHPELAATLRNVINVFDRVWYGYQPLDSETYVWYEQQVRELQEQQ